MTKLLSLVAMCYLLACSPPIAQPQCKDTMQAGDQMVLTVQGKAEFYYATHTTQGKAYTVKFQDFEDPIVPDFYYYVDDIKTVVTLFTNPQGSNVLKNPEWFCVTNVQ